MANPEKRSDAWPSNVLTPCFDLVHNLADQVRMSGMTKRAIIIFENSGVMIQALKFYTGRDGYPEAKTIFEELLAGAPDNAAWAGDQRAADFAILHSHSLVAMWSYLESAIEEVGVRVVVGDVDAVRSIGMLGVVAPKGMGQPPTEEHARKLLRKAEDTLKDSSWAGRVVALWSAMGLDLAIDRAQQAMLDEVNELRNCLLHRAGVVDARAVEKAPGLAPALGKAFSVSEMYHLRAYGAFSRAAVAMTTSVTRYIRPRLPADKDSK